jgi:2-dehydro-3-deoxyphosphogalactonate aldolase
MKGDLTSELPLIAILRGVKPTEITSVAEALVTAGIKYIEVPLNSPEPFSSIEMLVAACGDDAVCGAGTVMSVEQVNRLSEIGAQLIVSPHLDPEIVEASLNKDMLVFPGVATATEALTAVAAGATHLKLFPAGDLGSRFLGSVREVIPKQVKIFAVGHIGANEFDKFWSAGASGFGIGSGLYRPGDSAEAVFERAKQYVAIMKTLASGD